MILPAPYSCPLLGDDLKVNCPSCATTNPPEARFCMNCGTPLRAGQDEPGKGRTVPNREARDAQGIGGDSSFLGRYLPPELLTKLEAARSRGTMAGERRVITMLFCDLKGSTAAAERVDPEIWTEIMNGAFERMIGPIYKYEGTVPRLMGDAILAFFGAPFAHEDDPQRAVLAALDIQAGMQPYAEGIRREHGLEFGLRVGINTGLVVVGEIGSDLRMEYTAIGDAINLAARMEQTAAPGTVQITEETYKLIAPLFDCEPLGGIEVKGKTEPVHAYRVVQRKAEPGRLRGVQGLSSPLVGRDEPLSLLRSRMAALGEGVGAFVAVIGEAGLGKSSLVAELRTEVSANSADSTDQGGRGLPGPGRLGTGMTWLHGDGVAYARSVGYFLWRQIIRGSIGTRAEDEPSQVREKLGTECAVTGVPDPDIPLLEALLSVESVESSRILSSYQGEALVERMAEAVSTYLALRARAGPLVLVFEDSHWADEASMTLLAKASELAMHEPILFLCLLRPDQDARSWPAIQEVEGKLGHSYASILLQPLESEQTGTLLMNLLGMQDLPRGLRELIVEKAGGNPFFVEELIRSLIETKQIVREDGHWHAVMREQHPAALPDTLRGLLGTRIDRLPEPARHTLQMASVIGRTFDVRVLERLAHVRELRVHLTRLVEAGLLEGDLPRGPEEDEGVIRVNPGGAWDTQTYEPVQLAGRAAELTFRHVLIQEAAYESILVKSRRELHRQVGEALEELHLGRIEEFAAELAHHFHEAQDDRSLKYDLLAGDKAARLYANAEATTHYRCALETAKRIALETAPTAEIYSKLGGVLELSGRYAEALGTYQEMQAFARERQAPARELQALMAQGTIYSTPTALHNAEMGEKTMIEALELSKLVGDVGIQTRLNWNMMLNSLHARRVQAAFDYGQRALELARQGSDREQLAFVLNDLGRVLVSLGDFDEAFGRIREARELWRELDNQVMLADNLGAEGEALYSMGRFEDGMRIEAQALQIADAVDNAWGQSYHRLLLGLDRFGRGDTAGAIPLMTEAIEMGDRGGLIISSIAGRCDLAWCHGVSGDIDQGLELLETAIQTANEHLPEWVVIPIAMQVRLYALRGDRAAAEAAATGVTFTPPSLAYAHYTMMVELAPVELARLRADQEEVLKLADQIVDELRKTLPGEMPFVMKRKAEALRLLGRSPEAEEVLREAGVYSHQSQREHNGSTLRETNADEPG